MSVPYLLSFPSFSSFVLSPSLLLYLCTTVLLNLLPAYMLAERCVALCAALLLSRTLYVGRWPFPGSSHNPTDSIDWWNLAGALL